MELGHTRDKQQSKDKLSNGAIRLIVANIRLKLVNITNKNPTLPTTLELMMLLRLAREKKDPPNADKNDPPGIGICNTT